MSDIDFASVSPCDYADALPREQFADPEIKPLWQPIPRISGPAFTVKCAPGDHLMLHAAIYEANPGDIIVVHGDNKHALAGGNVCAIAQQRGIKGFILDGFIRDKAEIRDAQFPVFAKGVIPKPGAKKVYTKLNIPIVCGGVSVSPGDIVVADEEGIAFIPQSQASEVFAIAKARFDTDAALTLSQWQSKHHAKIKQLLDELGD
ncbi:MAG: RraA family protein [Aestuariibacter sp.]